MLSRLLLTLALVAFASGAKAQGTNSNDSVGYCSFTPASATLLTSCSGGIPLSATWALICAYTQNVNYRDDPTGTAPTATAGTGGQQIAAGQCISYNGNLRRFQVIQQTASAVVGVTFYAGVN